MMWIVSRRHHQAELAAARAEADRQRQRAETAEEHAATAVYNRKQTLRQNAELDAANHRLTGRIDELTRRLEARPQFENSAALNARIRHLERQLDDATGLPPDRIEDSRRWQPGYQTSKEDAS